MCCVSRSLIFCFHAVCTVSASFKHFASSNRCFLFQRTMPGHVGGRRGACMACDSNAHWCSLAGEAVSKRIILWKLGNFGGAPVSESLRGGPVCWNCRKSSLAFLKVRRAHPFMILSFLFCVLCFAFFVVLFIFTALGLCWILFFVPHMPIPMHSHGHSCCCVDWADLWGSGS